MYRNAKAELVRVGMGLAELADAMESYPSTWSEKLNGKRMITLDEAKKFKQVVKSELPLEELFKKFEEAC